MFTAYAHVPGYLLLFPLVLGSLAYFALATARHLRVLALARPVPRFDQTALRVRGLVRYALAQTKMFKDRRAGLMHFGIFWGFVLLTIGTADIVTGGLIATAVGWPLDGALWALVAAMQNVVALIVLVAIAYAFWRRLVTRPARLTYTSGALVILALIGGVVLTELIAMALEAALRGDRPGAFITNALAVPLREASSDLVNAAFVLFWWAHMLLVAAFICYLPGSKHLHIVASFFNIYLRKLQPRGALPAMDLEREDQPYGVRTIADLGWKDLLDSFTCTECGRCTASCPANLTGKLLNPKELVMGLRHMAVESEGELRPLLRFRRTGPALAPAPSAPGVVAVPIVDTAIPFGAVWDCVTCGACVEACPVLIEHVDKIVALRRNLVLEDTRFPPELQPMFRSLESTGNPWGQPASARLGWTRPLPFAVHTVADVAAAGELDSVEVLYWVGCAAAFDERTQKVARAVVTCLKAANVRFAVLGTEESCTGDPARRTGNEYVFQLLAASNIETLKRYGMERRTIITACPHCLNSIGVEYRQLGGQFEVVHHAVYLQRLIAEGRLRIDVASVRKSVTLHDSCYLARYADEVAAPREVLAACRGLELNELERSGRSTFCCGAGGGRMWMEETAGTRINIERAREVVASGAETVVTECPFCLTMLRDGLADESPGSAIESVDLAELVAARLASVDAVPPEAAVAS